MEKSHKNLRIHVCWREGACSQPAASDASHIQLQISALVQVDGGGGVWPGEDLKTQEMCLSLHEVLLKKREKFWFSSVFGR